jgi:hypothetical protein
MSSSTKNDFGGVWGSSSSDVFAVSHAGTILHYDGSTWTPMTSTWNISLAGVWGSSGSDVFAVGSAGTILHYDGNTAPFAAGDSYTTTEDTVLNVATPGLLANDSDVDGDSLTVSSQTQPQGGAVTLGGDGAFSYQPTANFCGRDRFAYSVRDGGGAAATATLTIQVACLNDPPLLGAITGALAPAPAGSAISLTATFTDPDPEDTFTAFWEWGDGATSPGIVDQAAHLVTGSHGYAEVGAYTVRLGVFDQAGLDFTAEVVITVIHPLYLPLMYR